MVAAYRAGASVEELAERFGVHRTTAVAHLRRRQVQRRAAFTARDHDDLSAAAAHYASGASLASVAARYGVVRMGPATLYGTLKRLVDHGLAEELARRPDATDDARRRYYRLTGLGQLVCAAEADRLAHLVRIARTNLRPGLA